MLNDANNSVEWTAYKTTEKVPVKGKFTKVDVTSGGEIRLKKQLIMQSFQYLLVVFLLLTVVEIIRLENSFLVLWIMQNYYQGN